MKIFSRINVSKLKPGEGKLDDLADFFSALGDPTTLKILRILSKRKRLCVTDIALSLSASISRVSHQMAKLKKLGVVRTEREGKMICYFLLDHPLIRIVEKKFLNNVH